MKTTLMLVLISLAVIPFTTNAQTPSSSTSKHDTKAISGAIVMRGEIERDGKTVEFTETTPITDLVEFYAERGIAYVESTSSGNTTQGGFGDPPPTIPPPGPGTVPSYVTYVSMRALGGGYIRRTSYNRTIIQTPGGMTNSPWVIITDGISVAGPGCNIGNLDQCSIRLE
ncbi:hypothetical protein [Dokdonella sp.]|uniref:hypothetical protein n=1 Tax=Dokdonella sp. TaxID=2291710 RepID=UPI003BAE932A